METRTITSNAFVNATDELIICNSSNVILLSLPASVGNARQLVVKNIGTGAVYIVTPDLIDAAKFQSLNQYDSVELQDYVSGSWGVMRYIRDREATSGYVQHTLYVDGSRTDNYVADGSQSRPYKTIQPAIDVVAANTLIHIAADTYPQAVFVVDVSAGIYSGNLAIGNVKNLRFQLHGAYITGNITYTTTMVGGSADNYYSRLEFVGVAGNRPEKGAAGRITGTITATRNNDSLSYISFSGMDLQGAIAFNTNGTWVVAMHNCMLSARMSCGDAAIALLETTGHTIITGHLAAAADAVTAISLYSCDNCEFDLINISNGAGSRITNCRFGSNVTITAGTIYTDAISWKSLTAQTETLVGASISFLDKTGPDLTPVARTNNPVLAANDINANIAALDACIGTDGDITPTTRTVGQIVVNATVNAKFETVDQVIGFDAQLSGTPKLISKNNTIYQNLDKLDTYCTVRTIKKTVGNVGVTADFNFSSAADANEQSINLGSILPAKCRLVDVMVYTDAAFTNLGALTTDVGLTTGTDGLIGAANNTALDAIMAAANAGAFISTPNAAAQNVWLNVKPTNNWDSANPVGRMSVYVTFIDVSNV